jgi:hypothetical protein
MWPNHIWNANQPIDQLARADKVNHHPPFHTLKNQNSDFRFWDAIYNSDYDRSLIILDSLELDFAFRRIEEIKNHSKFPSVDGAAHSDELAKIDYAVINTLRIPLWLALGKYDAVRHHVIPGELRFFNIPPSSLVSQAIRELSPMPLSQRRKELLQALLDIKPARKQAHSHFQEKIGGYPSLHNPDDTTEYVVNFHGFLFYGGSASPETTYSLRNPGFDTVIKSTSTMEALETILDHPVISDLYCRDPSLSERCADTTFPVNLRECAAAPPSAKGSATPPGCINPDGSVKSWWSNCGIERIE